MYSIKEKAISLYEINKSKFYGLLIPLDNTEEIDSILDNIKKEYRDATHYCYAYIYDTKKRFNDDGEPGGTAGMPILNVLENNNLDHILAVVVRYFGGIKLGAGGLVRAYTNSICETLNNSKIINLIKGIEIKITFDYNNSKQIDYLLKDYTIVNKEYNNEITYIIHIPENINILDKIEKYITNYKVINNIYIPKKEE